MTQPINLKWDPTRKCYYILIIIFGGDFLKSMIINVNRLFIVKSIFVCLFLLYILVVVDFTLLNDYFGRNISNIFSAEKATVDEYLLQKINLIPFATVKLFINAYKESKLETFVVLENILGNFFVIMPFALFVPVCFKSINNTLKFLCVISFGVLIIEILQIIFLTGSADIDDFILNVGGAMVAYAVLNIAKIKSGINKILFGEVNEIKS